jgi:hypothetical protein
MFGTARTLSESLLNIGESVIGYFVAAGLVLVVGRWIWPSTIEWWQQRSRSSAAKALVALDSQIPNAQVE